MLSRAAFFKNLFFFFFKQFRHPKCIYRSFSNVNVGQSKYQKHPSLSHRSDLSSKTLVFNVEEALLRSSSMFPYFMLVAFEAGSIFRALILFLLYPVTLLVGEEVGLKIMVFLCFFGIKKDSFRVGSAVLPKFFLEDVGLEAFEVIQKGGRKVAFSEFPQPMIESFLREYFEIDCVVGRELKSIHGYFVGLIEPREEEMIALEEIGADKKIASHDMIGITTLDRSADHQLFAYCKEIYLVRRAEKRSWQSLPKDRYPRPLIFHDGRLALRPTPLATLALFMWLPFAFTIALIRAVAGLTLPYYISFPLLAFCGFRVTMSETKNPHTLSGKEDHRNPKKGVLYVCNHRTLLDPLYLSFTLKKNFTAVTYSLSRVSEMLSPIKTVRLTRNRDRDSKMMEELLSQGDLVICPEGTTCREPYVLRFSPLFSEMSDDIIPVALESQVSMFHGTTAGGLKCLDPLFFLMNPVPCYTIRVLEGVSGLSKINPENQCPKSSFDVANHVQSEIGKALGFQCTNLTRRDKYLILAGNEGISGSSKKS
ncbi:hypothetical protein K2173_008143 [Erythroxylum novogranatense]|uniref:Phospholipid/glycerol acyltransferase domain-containing protein n=1 Tax=Erythroxylum novogranatense TaxID=1862640 RepID=A0AAV8S9G2_9ROSI|nr:hypothetical protein K2173_008143 [Erythroxylum novogranatense]